MRALSNFDPPDALQLTTADLAPGDARSTRFDWTNVTVKHLRSVADEGFGPAYAALWTEFGEKNELESRDVLARRFAWRPEAAADGGRRKLYDFVAIRHGDTLAAVADHTAVVDLDRQHMPLIVHLSHIWIAPTYRGSGLAGWVRALPIRTARECLRRSGADDRHVTLVGEMEHAAIERPDGVGRLIAFEKAGFSKIDPTRVPYAQPDFRPAVEIEADGGPRPVPLSLVVRRVGREAERQITGGELTGIAVGLLSVYEDLMSLDARRLFRRMLTEFPSEDETVALIPPTTLRPPLLRIHGRGLG